MEGFYNLIAAIKHGEEEMTEDQKEKLKTEVDFTVKEHTLPFGEDSETDGSLIAEKIANVYLF